ncbi:unnamed protein product [Rotaria sordida]|uniref:PI3K/PI4K catalytic domain-containing protein n=1 Tax=Rotaria sordida TaxID=392033 RepID=A0A815D7H9_9BILA|nr:unnamed protein product [Rotaria sordida]CAF3885276.1 unnamed protein product [Rotaria sordida]
MTFTIRLKVTEFDPLLIDYKVQSLLYMSYCALRQRYFKLDEKIPHAKHKQLEIYLYGLENNNYQIQQADLLIYQLFYKSINILKENIEKQQTHLQNLSTSLRIPKENILTRHYNQLATISHDYLRRYENNQDENNLLTNLFNRDHGNKIAELIVKSLLLSIKYRSNQGVKRDTRLILGNISLKLINIIQDKTNINHYSTCFSSTFRQQNLLLDKSSIRQLEIPGQYTTKKQKPLIEHHIKIVVKAGEDIRQDQRIQPLFSIINDLYDNYPNSNQSNSAHIALRTYKVIPISSKLGMIEWLDNTRPLKYLIQESYNDNQLYIITNQGQHPIKLYQDYHLSVPELIPIRLTRQFTQLMSHIGRAGLFRATMIHRMNALRQNSDLLEHALKTKINILRSDDIYAKDRIKSTRFKLNGINPTLIIGFLRSSNLKEARHQMEKVVRGDQIDSKRAQILLKYNSNRYHKLTVDE